MADRNKIQFPTAKDSGGSFELALIADGELVCGISGREFLLNIVRFIDMHNRLESLALPFTTTGEAYLLASAPVHSSGHEFASIAAYTRTSDGGTIFINTNHPRFYALRLGARMLEAAGFEVARP